MNNAIKIFFGILIPLSAILNYFLFLEGTIQSPKGQAIVGIMMFVPAISYLGVRLLVKEYTPKVNFKFKNPQAIVSAYLLPFGYLSITYGVIWGMGFYNNEFAIDILIAGLVGTVLNSLVVIGEEIGWRGFLLNEVNKSYSQLKSAFIVGLIWSLWHVPGLLFTDYGNNTNLLYGIPFFVISLTMISIPMSYYVFKAKNIWPAVLMHSSHNALIQVLCDPLTTSSPESNFLKNETGLLLMIVSVIIGVIYILKMKNKDDGLAQQIA